MPVNDYRLLQISSNDINGPTATAVVALRPKRSVQSDVVDGDEARAHALVIQLLPAEKQRMQDIFARAAARMDFRRAKRAADGVSELSDTQDGEP